MANNTATENEADSGSSVVPTTATLADKDDDQLEDIVTASNGTFDTAKSSHKCNRCEFEASTLTALTNHITISHLAINDIEMENAENNNTPPDRAHRKMFECDVCNMKFSNGANMRRHKMRHTGVKPYECRVCQKRFFRKDHLAEHFTTHTKTLPYHCPICNRGFQRQIAMRAHFQNEHVGQHDMVKSCPLCNFRATSMKSLRVHFHNRHGIDLDNPGAAASQSHLIAAVAQQSFNQAEGALNSLNQLSSNVSVSLTSGAAYSDSGDSNGNRSADNATPPMHFLTPHVEISMADAPTAVYSLQTDQPAQRTSQSSQVEMPRLMNGDSPNSPQSADSNSNSNTPSSSLNIPPNSLRIEQETSITPSISLIPIKQEPGEETVDGTRRSGGHANNNGSSPESDGVRVQNATSSSLSSLIKVSPLKSLLRDDLKRKLMSRSNSANRGRSTESPNNNVNNKNSESPSIDGNNVANGTITSTGTEQHTDPSTLWPSTAKQSLQCAFCAVIFPDQTLYFLHKGCHSDANPWKCNICGEQCCNVYEFHSHLLSKSHQ